MKRIDYVINNLKKFKVRTKTKSKKKFKENKGKRGQRKKGQNWILTIIL